MATARDVARMLRPDLAPPVAQPMVQGVVTALTGSPSAVSVRVGADTTALTGIRYLGWYTPTVNDVVWLQPLGHGDYLCLGTIKP